MTALGHGFSGSVLVPDHSLFKTGPFPNHKLNRACLVSFLLIFLVLFTLVRIAFGLVTLP